MKHWSEVAYELTQRRLQWKKRILSEMLETTSKKKRKKILDSYLNN